MDQIDIFGIDLITLRPEANAIARPPSAPPLASESPPVWAIFGQHSVPPYINTPLRRTIDVPLRMAGSQYLSRERKNNAYLNSR